MSAASLPGSHPPSAPATSDVPTAPATAAQSPSRRVVDAPTRVFHWLFALSFLGAYLSAESEQWRVLHVVLGYTVAGLLVLRVVYGLLGPKHARLGLLWRKLASAPAWLGTLFSAPSAQGINWQQGQNLLMALAVAALLITVVPLTLSGYASFNEWGNAWLGEQLSEGLGELHEALGEAFLAIVLAHVGLIAGLSLLRRKNQALPMITGRTPGAGPDLVRDTRMGLAALLLAAVLGYWAWEWQQPTPGASDATMMTPETQGTRIERLLRAIPGGLAGGQGQRESEEAGED